MIDKHVRARRADNRDAEVGRRVRSRRLECRLSQTELADRIGVTFQQVQKYEKGVNRIGAGRLQRISEALEVPISFFFGGGTSSTQREAAGAESVFGFMQTSRLRSASSRRSTRSRAARRASFWSRWRKNSPTWKPPDASSAARDEAALRDQP